MTPPCVLTLTLSSEEAGRLQCQKTTIGKYGMENAQENSRQASIIKTGEIAATNLQKKPSEAGCLTARWNKILLLEGNQ